MTRIRWILATLVMALLAGLPTSANGQDITMVGVMKAKAGSEAGFEAALKAHMELREANGDPWDWTFYQVVIGKEAGAYMARSSGHSWADFDGYFGSEFAETVDPHWAATVQPLIEDSYNLVDQSNAELSRLPESMDPYTLFNATVFHLKPDQIMAFTEAIGTYKQLIEDHDFSFYWVVQSQVAGTEGPTMALVGFAENWAEMAEDPALEEAMMEDLGEEAAMALMQQFSGAYHYSENYIVMLRPDLSSGGGM
jgi:hypothetical protein